MKIKSNVVKSLLDKNKSSFWMNYFKGDVVEFSRQSLEKENITVIIIKVFFTAVPQWRLLN